MTATRSIALSSRQTATSISRAQPDQPNSDRTPPSVLARRDLLSGGTWLGLTSCGRLAAVTNYRDPRWCVPKPLSHGLLIADYLTGDLTSEAFLADVKSRGNRYQGFNLLLGDQSALLYYSPRMPCSQVKESDYG